MSLSVGVSRAVSFFAALPIAQRGCTCDAFENPAKVFPTGKAHEVGDSDHWNFFVYIKQAFGLGNPYLVYETSQIYTRYRLEEGGYINAPEANLCRNLIQR